MTLRINTNIAAMRAARQVGTADRNLAESLMRLSSGFKINKAADDPAGLVISEQMRGQIASINQAIANAELAGNMVQTTEASLTEMNNLLIRMRELALHAANEGATDRQAVAADQREIRSAVETISRLAHSTQFGQRNLLDGSTGVSGAAQGEGLTFLSATAETATSPVDGYVVDVERVATRATLEGDTELDEDNVKGLRVTLFEGGKTVQVIGGERDTPASFVGRLRSEVASVGLPLEVELTEDDTLRVTHREYGSERSFQAASSEAGVLSEDAGVMQAAMPGQDIAGTINGEAARGRGQVLEGLEGTENIAGLRVSYAGPLEVVDEGPDGEPIRERQPTTGLVGAVNVTNNALNFQVGPNAGQQVRVALPVADPSYLARNVSNRSGFENLAEVDVTTEQGAADSLHLVDAAIDQLTLIRGELGAFHKNTLETNMSSLRVAAENLAAAESTIRDVDVARELARFTRHKIQFDMAAAMAAQANHMPRTVIELLK